MAPDGFFKVIDAGQKLIDTEIHSAENRLGRSVYKYGSIGTGEKLINREQCAGRRNCHPPEEPVNAGLIPAPLDKQFQNQPAGEACQNNVRLEQQRNDTPVKNRLFRTIRPENRKDHDEKGNDAVRSRHNGGVIAESKAEERNDLQDVSKRSTEQKNGRRNRHENETDIAEAAERQSKFCKRTDDQKPETGMPFNAQICKEFGKCGVFRNSPGLCFIPECLMMQNQKEMKAEIQGQQKHKKNGSAVSGSADNIHK